VAQLTPLREPFNDVELTSFLSELLKHIRKISRGAPEDLVYRDFNLPNYMTINAASSDSGIPCCGKDQVHFSL
jgi:hypothetical protein